MPSIVTDNNVTDIVSLCLTHRRHLRVNRQACRQVEPTCPTFTQLKQWDILLSFDGVRIANDGSVAFRSGERISFSYLVSQKYTDDSAVLEVLSGKEVKKLTVQLAVRGPPPS